MGSKPLFGIGGQKEKGQRDMSMGVSVCIAFGQLISDTTRLGYSKRNIREASITGNFSHLV